MHGSFAADMLAQMCMSDSISVIGKRNPTLKTRRQFPITLKELMQILNIIEEI